VNRTPTHPASPRSPQGEALAGPGSGDASAFGARIRVAIAGVGNCASSLVQGVEYYKDADPADDVPGLMHVLLGGYHAWLERRRSRPRWIRSSALARDRGRR